MASLLLFVGSIWGAVAKSFGSLLASTIVGLSGGGAECLVAVMVNVSFAILVVFNHSIPWLSPKLSWKQDMFFLHERGGKMGYYMIANSWGSTLGPLCGGFIIDRMSPRFFVNKRLLITVRPWMAMVEMDRSHTDRRQFPHDHFLRPRNALPSPPSYTHTSHIQRTDR